MSTTEPQTHTVVCVDTLVLRPNKFKHLGAELDAGVSLKEETWEYYAGYIKAIVVPYVVRTDFSKNAPEMIAAIKVLKADAAAFVESVAKCEIHPADWSVSFRSSDVMGNRFFVQPTQTWACGTLVHKED